MKERLTELESRLESVVDRLADIETRLRSLEDLPAPASAAPQTPATGQQGPDDLRSEDLATDTVLDEHALSHAAALLGRTLMIFGGAYLLRALTDLNFIPTGIGIVLGGAYSLLWLAMAYRSAGTSSKRSGAIFYGVASALLAFPLLVESATRYELLSGPASAVALAVYCGLALVVAVGGRMPSLAWLTALGGIGTAMVLLRATRSAEALVVFLLLLGLGTLWAAYRCSWKGLQWVGALGADLGVVVLAILSSSDRWMIEARWAYFAAAALLIAYLGSIAVRSHLQRHQLGLFEGLQGILATMVAAWTGVRAGLHSELSPAGMGGLSILLGAGAYGLAFSPETRHTRGRNFFVYTTLGLILSIVGCALMMPIDKAAAFWSILAVVLAWLSGRYRRVTLSLHCALFLSAAAVGSGLLRGVWDAFWSNPTGTWAPIQPLHYLVAVASVACLFIPVTQQSARWGKLAGLPQVLVLTLAVWEVSGVLVALLAPVLAGAPGAEADPAVLAALRTAALAICPVTLAWAATRPRWPEARWLVYPVLGLVGVKMIIEDFPNGRPVTLFVALALVGGALMMVARLARRRSS